MGDVRILIVDDSATIVAQLGRILDDLLPGAEVYAAPELVSARAFFAQHRPHVVFLDVMLGGGANGGALLPAFAKATWKTHAIVMTAFPRDHPDVVAAFSHGAFGYVEKPLRRAAIVAALQELEIETSITGEARADPSRSAPDTSRRSGSPGR